MTRAARILLVDDDASIQRAVAPLLRSRGYEVEVVGTGGSALKIVAEHPPDLVVLDLGLPDLEGTEVCRRMRASACGRHTRRSLHTARMFRSARSPPTRCLLAAR